MKKSKLRIIFIVLALILGTGYYVYDGFNNAPSRIKINYKNIQSDKIHSDLDGLQIAFISDLHYLGYFDDARLDNMIDTLNKANPDVIVFLGDLVEKEMSEEQYAKLATSLKSTKAKYGKFAVLGEADYASEEISTQVMKLLYESEFEVLHNNSIHITKETQSKIQLVGIDSPLNQKADIEHAYTGIDEAIFTITAVHTPDTAEELPYNQTDLVVAGHSHGGQIKIPLLGQVYNREMAEKYYSGLYQIRNMNLYVTNGVGTVKDDVRINAPAEILIYTLKSSKSK